MPPTQLFELTPAESMFAPFHDGTVAEQLPLTLEAGAARGLRRDFGWDGTKISWDLAAPGQVAARFAMAVSGLPERFDHFVFCHVAPAHVTLTFEACRGGRWSPLGEPVAGRGRRHELTRPIGERPVEAVRVTLTATAAAPVHLSLQWWGLARAALVAELAAARPRYDGRWTGLILPPEEWPEPRLARGLLFDVGDLPALRAKRAAPYWAEHWRLLEERAQQYLGRSPEDQLDDYLPQTDQRYIRAREAGRATYFSEPLILGFVGLVNGDRALGFHALRYLMCLLHTTSWAQSAESRARGSVWDQRCFNEEMATTAAALLLDWYDFALTPRARYLAQQVLWDKGLAVIERDMLKWDYLYTMNQGPWFCRARLLAGLYLETVWPRMRAHTELALGDLQAGMANYLLPDGGTDEGLGYFSVTLHAVLPGLIAYARARGQAVAPLLPPQFVHTEAFVAALSAMEPGKVITEGDNTTDLVVGDTVALLAAIYPASVYARVAGACLTRRRPPGYYDQYFTEGVFAFVAGPTRLAVPESIVPEFARLPQTGHLTSRRHTAAGRTVRLHVVGAKARASHTHLDKGSFLLELDRFPVLLDRGQVRYDDLRTQLLKRTELHNTLTPVTAEGIYLNQGSVEQAVIPEGEGDARRLRVRVDLGHVWRGVMASCIREISADEPEVFSVRDRGELLAPSALAFNLNTRVPWEIQGRTAVLRVDGWELALAAPWADEICQQEDSIDFRLEPVWHLEARLHSARAFDLLTTFTCRPL
ncbi:MAG: heparinase II/III family protein [Verrucomicrobia bacterium]|nr:heparinase II/III family protein [Verrucomicrobiota bacterium]